MKKLICSLAAFASLSAFGQASTDELPLDLALEWAQESIAACKENGYNVTATYMNNNSVVKLVLRSDGAREGTVGIGYRKAYTVIKTGMSTADFARSVGIDPEGTIPSVPGAPPGTPPGDNVDPNTIVFAGGHPVMMGGKVVGAVSISGAPGGPKDVACAEAGLAKIAHSLM